MNKSVIEFDRYNGYIHQLKYTCGHTYGDATHELKISKLERSKTTLGLGEGSIRWKPHHLRNRLPKTNGVNRLTESMVPGYTGKYVMSLKEFLSKTFLRVFVYRNVKMIENYLRL